MSLFRAPLYVARPRHLHVIDRALAGFFAVCILAATVLAAMRLTAAPAILVFALSAVAAFSLAYVAIPRAYEVWTDRLSIRFMFGLRWHVPFETIVDIGLAHRIEAFVSIGVRLTTGGLTTVQIRRVRENVFGRPKILISPENSEGFIRTAMEALTAHRRTKR